MSNTYLCTAIVIVEDEPGLIEYANGRVQECWADSLESMRDRSQTLVEAALQEALFASNENPSPADYGISFQEIRVQSLDPSELSTDEANEVLRGLSYPKEV